MRFVSKKVIEIRRELSDLDRFALDFVRILRKHSRYSIVSGYVSILLGRARASEDIDIIIPPAGLPEFLRLLEGIESAGFYCLNEETGEDIYEHLKSGVAARFAKLKTVIPNVELKFAKSRIDDITLDDAIAIMLGKEELKVSPLELQIAFKEAVLKSPKDMEDARHIRNVAAGHLDAGLIKKYGVMLDGLYRRKP